MIRALPPSSNSSNAVRSTQPRNAKQKEAAPCKRATYNQVANGIAILRPQFRQDVSGCLRLRQTKTTLEDTLSLVNGEAPTFLSYACRNQRTERQQAAHVRRMRLKREGFPVTAHKCAERLRLERDGGILVMDGYLNKHTDTHLAESSSAYRDHFDSNPPPADRRLAVRQRLTRTTRYLVNEALLGHRPIFERIPTTEIYGEGAEYICSDDATMHVKRKDVDTSYETSAPLPLCSRVTKPLNSVIVMGDIADSGSESELMPLTSASSQTDVWSMASVTVKRMDSAEASSSPEAIPMIVAK